MLREMETEECSRIELGNLCPQVIYSIFSRIPLKPLTRLKCVSRAWCHFIENFRRSNPPTTASGLVVLLNRVAKENQAFQEFICVRAQEGGRDGKFRTTIHASFKHNFPLHLIDSCDGLLLYAANDGQLWTYYICDPFLDRCLALPRVHEVTRLACAGLAFDGSCQKFFRVIAFFLKEIDFVEGSTRCKNFSSETWNWEIVEARIFNIDLALGKGFDREQLFGASVFFEGRLYWIWSVCMLVYDTRGGSFKLIPLPLKAAGNKSNNSSNMLSQLLWESDGQICFCHQLNELLCIFTFIGGDGDLLSEGNDYSLGCCLWQLKRSVTLMELIVRKLDYRNGENLLELRARFRIRPCAFNPDLQLLFLHVPPGRIVSYSLETGEFAPVWSCGELELGSSSHVHKVLPLNFKSAHLFAADQSFYHKVYDQ